MGPGDRGIFQDALFAFLINLFFYTYLLSKVLRMVPVDPHVASETVLFFPILAIVVFGLVKRRRWSLILGLVFSLYLVTSSVLGFLLLGWLEFVLTVTVNPVQIGICAYGLKKLGR